MNSRTFKYIAFFFFTLVLYSCNESSIDSSSSHEENVSSANFKTAKDFINIPQTRVLVLGVFHFDYPNLDALKVEEKDQADVLSASRQNEMNQLLDYLQKFKPTKIAIEAHDDSFTKALKAYDVNNPLSNRDERYQLGVKLAHAMSFDTLYPLDAYALLQELESENPKLVADLWKDYDWQSDSKLDSLKRNWFEYQTELLKTTSLLDYLKYINTQESHHYGYGTYLVDDFKLGEFQGADNLSTYWYNRNLRIFRKIQNMTEGPDDRILVIIGNGHAALLRQFLSYSPEFDFVEFDSL